MSPILAALLMVSMCFTYGESACSVIYVSNTNYQSSRHGSYYRSSSYTCSGYPVFTHYGGHYLYRVTISGSAAWLIGPTKCSTTGGMYVISSASSPELASGTWREYNGNKWVSNSAISVRCTNTVTKTTTAASTRYSRYSYYTRYSYTRYSYTRYSGSRYSVTTTSKPYSRTGTVGGSVGGVIGGIVLIIIVILIYIRGGGGGDSNEVQPFDGGSSESVPTYD